MRFRRLAAFLPFVLISAVPFLLRRGTGDGGASSGNGAPAEVLVVITSHSEPVKYEMARSFQRYYKEKYGKDIVVDYRSPGGTSDIVRYLYDRFYASFRKHWESQEGLPPWDDEIARAWSDPSHDSDGKMTLARRLFLASDAGAGVDIFAGGGTYDHGNLARIGLGVDGGVRERHKEYFSGAVIPLSFGGDKLYDPQGRYYGVCLSSFGICCNRDRLAELDDPKMPESWNDLADKRFFNTLVVADPTKSGSINKCFEAIIQQEMTRAEKQYGKLRGPGIGWADGMNLIKRIIANARTITDSAGKCVLDVSSGEAAAGMAIDYYGLSEAEYSSKRLLGGVSPVVYIPPKGSTSVSADPVMMLRGAPNKKAARAFLDHLLSLEGQKIFQFRPGTPGGPEKYALRRPPIRRDLYAPEYRAFRSDPDYDPYEAGKDYVYRPEWTGRYFDLIRVMIKCCMLDPHRELALARKNIDLAGGMEKVPLAAAEFNKLPFDYAEAGNMAAILRQGSPESALEAAKLRRKWVTESKAQYLRAAELAAQGR